MSGETDKATSATSGDQGQVVGQIEETDEEGRGGGVLDAMRGMGVGTDDPNIVGEVGPTDVPPGRDEPPRDPWVTTDEPTDGIET